VTELCKIKKHAQQVEQLRRRLCDTDRRSQTYGTEHFHFNEKDLIPNYERNAKNKK
jgi:hypothetical protein